MTTRWTKFCIVGFGGHARTKLVPAIQQIGGEVAGVVSRQAALEAGCRLFGSLDEALAELPREVLFVIASPPDAHYRQVREVLAAGHDVLVEKPAFLTGVDASEAGRLANQKNQILIEGFMHRWTRLYARFLADWQSFGDHATNLQVTFHVPSLPEGTFRTLDDVASSSLYDIGCYPVSLLDDLGFTLDQIGFFARETGAGHDRFTFGSHVTPCRVSCSVGTSDSYSNEVTVTLRDGETVTYRPFFYGRPGEREVESAVRGQATSALLDEGNAFEEMLNSSRPVLLDGQQQRVDGMVRVSACLERLASEWLSRAPGVALKPLNLANRS